MRSAYTTAREAPEGFVGVNRKLAEIIYSKGVPLVLCGDTVGTFDVVEGRHLGFVVQKINTTPFPLIVYNYLHALPSGLGRTCVFFAKKEEVSKVLSEITPGKILPKVRRQSHAGRH